MYIAMNRFRILPGKEDEFETLWRKRDSHLNEVEGFKSFNLIKGQANSDYTLYVSHSQWESKFILGIGQNPLHLRKLIKMQEKIITYIWNTQNLRVLW